MLFYNIYINKIRTKQTFIEAGSNKKSNIRSFNKRNVFVANLCVMLETILWQGLKIIITAKNSESQKENMMKN